MVKGCEPLVPPPPPGGVAKRLGGLTTYTAAAPAAATRFAGTVTLTCVAEGAGMGNTASMVEVPPLFQNTLAACVGSELVTKLLPVTVMVNGAEPAAVVAGLMESSIGTGLGAKTLNARGLL